MAKFGSTITEEFKSVFLRRFSKVLTFSTLFLIFVGGLVKSTESGLAVPDWPLSYGMLFPPMVGGVFFEHGHRMVAAAVGFLTLILAVLLGLWEERRWVRHLGFAALGVVIAQGILGGITVLFFLPKPISIAHGVLAQTFFVITIILAYAQSEERLTRSIQSAEIFDASFVKFAVFFVFLIYVQLILGALMRHTASGLAIPDFPEMEGKWIPAFDEPMLMSINDQRFEMNLDPVTGTQVFFHFIHRFTALIIFIAAQILLILGLKNYKDRRAVQQSIFLLDAFVGVQIALGIFTVLMQKEPYITSVHVVTGAAVLGLSVLLVLRAAPISSENFKKVFI